MKKRNKYYESGLCGFLKNSEKLKNNETSLCEEIKFSIWQNKAYTKSNKVSKAKIIMASIANRMKALAIFPDISGYSGYKNS